jgi:hypothetical protein
MVAIQDNNRLDPGALESQDMTTKFQEPKPKPLQTTKSKSIAKTAL